MSDRAYLPARGDVVHMNFSPSAGHDDRHYAIVLSSTRYNRKSRMAVVCAIASPGRNWPFEVPVPGGLVPPGAGVGPVRSVVVADAVRQVDCREREMAFVAKAPKALVEEVLDRVLAVLEDD